MEGVGAPEAVSDRLLQSADVARYVAKRSSKGSYVIWSPDLRMGGEPLPEQARPTAVQAGAASGYSA